MLFYFYNEKSLDKVIIMIKKRRTQRANYKRQYRFNVKNYIDNDYDI